MSVQRTALRFTPLVIAVIGLVIAFVFLTQRTSHLVDEGNKLRVLSYSAFVASWGPGPELAKKFRERTGIQIEYRDAGDAGLLLKKLELFPSDVVLGLDGSILPAARAATAWRALPEDLVTDLSKGLAAEKKWQQGEFMAFDWAPLTFVFRQGEIEPPVSLQDLLHERFRGAIVLMDPRTSAPGLLFAKWVFSELGEAEALTFLRALKPNVHSVSSGWSQAYGIFTKRQAKLALSYLTSPVYHWIEEKDRSYQAAVFSSGHPVHVEYAGVPKGCTNCQAAEKFLRFLLEEETQKLIMSKNVMLPVIASAAVGSEFSLLPQVAQIDVRASTHQGGPQEAPQEAQAEQREKIFAIWQQSEL